MTTLVGRKAPDFTANAVLASGQINNQFKLSEAISGKYGLLFFYPLDFTFVCPSELIALDHRISLFKDRKVEVIGVSIDSHFSHAAWRNTPVDKGGVGPLGYTLVADLTHAITQAYGIEHPESGVAFRGAFLIDKQGVVRSQMVNDLPLGRSVDELLRLVDALQYHETHGEVCPAGWIKGQDGIKATSAGISDYLSKNAAKL